jgi:hypothetical protein
MPITKEPFRSYTTEEKDPLKDGRVFTVRLSADEYKKLSEAMAIMHISSDSTALKTLAMIGKNVAFLLLEPGIWSWLTGGERRIHESKLDKLKRQMDANVIESQEKGG